MTVASDRIQSRQLMIRSIRERIERDTHELNLVHEQLFTEGLSHEEFIRLTDRRNNLLAGIGLKEKEKYYYGFGELGFNRVYTAMQDKQQIEAVVNVPGWNDIRIHDVCALDDGEQFRISLVQPSKDEDGLRIMRLSLERIDEKYVIKTEGDTGDTEDGNG